MMMMMAVETKMGRFDMLTTAYYYAVMIQFVSCSFNSFEHKDIGDERGGGGMANDVPTVTINVTGKGIALYKL